MDFHRPATDQKYSQALGCVCRALRAWKFYPAGHPARKKSIAQACSAMLALLDGQNLSFVCGRSGFSLPDNQPLKDGSRLSTALSYELFIRRVRKLTFLGDLLQEDLLELVRILTLSPDAVQQAGGMEKLMAERGVRTIWANEFDLAAIRAKRQDVEAGGVVPSGLDELEDWAPGEAPHAPEPVETADAAIDTEEVLHSLLARLAVERDENAYLLLLRQANNCAELLMSRRELPPLLPLLELLSRHSGDEERGPGLVECARFGLEQLAAADGVLQFVLDLLDASGGVSSDVTRAVLAAGGPASIALMLERMAASDSRAVRKELANLLVRTGEPAVPAILGMMGDQRWYVIRNLAVILGGIGGDGSLAGLQQCLRHNDIRVNKEAIRSLAKVGSRDAEEALIALLREGDSRLLPQVIASLGGMKSGKALAELMRILCREDLFLKDLSLKMEALSAIAMIGDRSVTPALLEIIMSRNLIARGRWSSLKVAVADCLGKLADPQALPALRKLAARQGELGFVCSAVVASIERTGGVSHDGA